MEWVWEGFNATLVAFGQGGTGKTRALYGPDAAGAGEGLFHWVVQELFHRVAEERKGCYVGLSAWEIVANDTVDLLAHSHPNVLDRIHLSAIPGASMDFSTVQVATAAEVERVMALVRARSTNWGTEHGREVALPNRAHSFVRLLLYDPNARAISTLHFVDLVGAQSLSGRSPFTRRDPLSQQERERRIVNQHLLAFSRIVTEISQRSGEEAAERKVLSARDSKLTQHLGPLLAGNNRTFLLATVSPDGDDYIDTLNTLRVAHRATSITTACMKVKGVPMNDLAFLRLEQVLPPERPAARAPERPPASPYRVGSPGTLADIEPRKPLVAKAWSPSRRTPAGASYPPAEAQAPADRTYQELKETLQGQSIKVAETVFPREAFPAPGAAAAPPDEPLLGAEGDSLLDTSIWNEKLMQLKQEFRQIEAEISHHDASGAVDVGLPPPEAAVGEAAAAARPPPAAPAEPELPPAAPEDLVDNDLFPRPITAFGENEARVRADTERDRQQEFERRAVDKIKRLQSSYDSTLGILKAERVRSKGLEEAVARLEQDLIEVSTSYEVELDNAKIEAISMKSKCRKLQSETALADVFDKYEREISSLSDDVLSLKDENKKLHRRLALSYPAGDRPEPHTGKEDKKHLHLQKSFKKSEAECAKLRAELVEYKKKDRLYELHKRNAQDGHQKVNKLQRAMAEKENEVIRRNLETAEAEGQIVKLQEAIVQLNAENEHLTDVVKSLRDGNRLAKEKLNFMKRSGTRDSILERLPQFSGAQKSGRSAGGVVMIDLCRRLQRHKGNDPKTEHLLDRLLHEVTIAVDERNTFVKREQHLLAMLTGESMKEK